MMGFVVRVVSKREHRIRKDTPEKKISHFTSWSRPDMMIQNWELIDCVSRPVHPATEIITIFDRHIRTGRFKVYGTDCSCRSYPTRKVLKKLEIFFDLPVVWSLVVWFHVVRKTFSKYGHVITGVFPVLGEVGLQTLSSWVISTDYQPYPSRDSNFQNEKRKTKQISKFERVLACQRQ